MRSVSPMTESLIIAQHHQGVEGGQSEENVGDKVSDNVKV